MKVYRVRKMRNIICAIIAITGPCLTISGCITSKRDKHDMAKYVFTNGKIYAVNEHQPWAEAVALRGNEIVCVGDAAGTAAYIGEGTKQYDLDGKMLLPGFFSGHDHLVASRWISFGVDLYLADFFMIS